MACCDYHSAAVTTTGELYTFGSKENGKLGLGRDTPSGSAGHVTRVTRFLDTDEQTELEDVVIGNVKKKTVLLHMRSFFASSNASYTQSTSLLLALEDITVVPPLPPPFPPSLPSLPPPPPFLSPRWLVVKCLHWQCQKTVGKCLVLGRATIAPLERKASRVTTSSPWYTPHTITPSHHHTLTHTHIHHHTHTQTRTHSHTHHHTHTHTHTHTCIIITIIHTLSVNGVSYIYTQILTQYTFLLPTQLLGHLTAHGPFTRLACGNKSSAFITTSGKLCYCGTYTATCFNLEGAMKLKIAPFCSS